MSRGFEIKQFPLSSKINNHHILAFKQAFHDGDLEPEASENFKEVQDVIRTMLGFTHEGPADWVWFIVETLDWLGM